MSTKSKKSISVYYYYNESAEPKTLSSPNVENSKVGEVTQTATDALLKDITDTTYTSIKGTYENPFYGIVKGAGPSGIVTSGTNSLFNPLFIFRYAKYAQSADTYSPQYHKDIAPAYDTGKTLGQTAPKNTIEKIQENKKRFENPAAGVIIQWAQSTVNDNLDSTTLGPAPYQWNDFLWCKYYGKIPNNRMLTLRRYPIPVEDNLQINTEKMPLVPLAQAVTWFGGDTGNKLSNVINMTYGFNWEPLNSDVQDVNGNEVSVSDLLDTIGLDPNAKTAAFVRNLVTSLVFADKNNTLAASKLDEKYQAWVKEAWTKEGQYWNRVKGPVNVVNKTWMRGRGYSFDHNINVNFEYKLRSFGTVNPKIAMLDLIANFLTLTHNRAEFWGGSTRYFQKTGYTLPSFPTDKFERGDYTGGIREFLKVMAQVVQKKGGDLKNFLSDLSKNYKTSGATGAAATIESTSVAQAITGSWISGLMQKPLTMRSLLDGRAIGEWHLTVGNPMNPIAVIGNLCLKNTTISFSDSLGIDDFPDEVKFTVNLFPGRDRAKQDIESMFNLGAGDLTFTPLPPPSTAFNTFGEKVSTDIANAYKNREDANNTINQTRAGLGIDSLAKINDDYGVTKKTYSELDATSKANIAYYFKFNVARTYGAKFGVSPILTDYFTDLKTRD